MAIEVYDENKLRELPDEERLLTCERILKNDSDESKRWDANKPNKNTAHMARNANKHIISISYKRNDSIFCSFVICI